MKKKLALEIGFAITLKLILLLSLKIFCFSNPIDKNLTANTVGIQVFHLYSGGDRNDPL
jgi:hypothetical protein